MTAYMHAVKNSPSVQQEFRKLAVGSFPEAKRMFSSSPEVKNELSQTNRFQGATPNFLLIFFDQICPRLQYSPTPIGRL